MGSIAGATSKPNFQQAGRLAARVGEVFEIPPIPQGLPLILDAPKQPSEESGQYRC